MMIWVGAAAAISILLFYVGAGKRRSGAVEKLASLEDVCEFRDPENPVPRKTRLASAFLELPYRLTPVPLRDRLFGKLAALCDSPGVSVPRLAGMRVWATLVLPSLVLLLTGFSSASLVLAVAMAAFGVLLPRLACARARVRYLEAIRKALPDTADLLYALVLGGKNLDQAFRGAAALAREPLGPFLRHTVREIELGSTRAEAFARLSKRCPVAELASLLKSLLEAERRGHSVSSTLSVFSREIRLRRRDELREAGARVPVKMLAPLVFLILPASVLLTVGPTFLATLERVF